MLGRLQNFLPQMAAANDKLMVQIQDSPAGQFDIEQVEEAERVIEMVGLLGVLRCETELLLGLNNHLTCAVAMAQKTLCNGQTP